MLQQGQSKHRSTRPELLLEFNAATALLPLRREGASGLRLSGALGSRLTEAGITEAGLPAASAPRAVQDGPSAGPKIHQEQVSGSICACVQGSLVSPCFMSACFVR